MELRSVVSALLGLSIAWAVACSSSSSTPTADAASGSCAALASRCHPFKSTLAVECHELGHDGNDAVCGPRVAECLAECPEFVDDGGSAALDAGADATSEAGSDGGDRGTTCATYCSCMAATCAAQPGYPFADPATCTAACTGFTAEDRTCYAAACETARTAANRAHDCEHASGEVACH